ncbi:MAG: serine hydrolase [Alphaproteobacteria bacterium]|nr:serine hydrolase [Alphaproteobacteria bacterium]
MSKAIVSSAAMRQVDAGRLSLDAPLAEVLPALALPQVLDGFARDGTPRLRPASRAITLRHVLTHSAGFGYDTWNVDVSNYLRATGLPRTPADAAQLARTPLLFDPGTAWNYGISTDVAGLAVEAVTGERLDRHLAQGLLAELGMVDTAVVLSPAQRARRVTTMRRLPDDGFGDLGFSMDRGIQYCMGGGALHGTGRDYLRFIRLILNGGLHDGTRLLSPAAITALTTNQLEPGVRVRRMISSDPLRSHDAEFFPGQPKLWSAGFMITTEDAPTGRRAGSLAWAGIANTYCWIDPASGLGGVFMTQTLPFADPRTLAAFARFERAMYDMAG